MSCTIVILTKLPGHLPVKTRLWPALGEAAATALYRRMLAETAALARRFDPEPTVAYSPPGARPDLPEMGRCRFLPAEGEGGAACLESALRRAYRGEPLLALGGDAPDLPPDRIEAALSALEAFDAALVPTPDGGFSLLALRRPVEGLKEAFRYGGPDALSSLVRWLLGRGLSVAQLEPWRDIDEPEDLPAR